MQNVQIDESLMISLNKSQAKLVIVSDVDEVVLYHFEHIKEYLSHYRIHPLGFIHELGGELQYDNGGKVPLDTRMRLLDEAYRWFSRDQRALPGAVQFLKCLSKNYEVIFLTNVPRHSYADRVNRLRELGLPFPVVGNSGGKGRVVRALMGIAKKPFIFIDDSMRQIQNIRKHCRGVYCVHFTGTPETALLPRSVPLPDLRVYSWDELYDCLLKFDLEPPID